MFRLPLWCLMRLRGALGLLCCIILTPAPQLPKPVPCKKLAEEYLKLKPFHNDLFPSFPPDSAEFGANDCVEFCCLMEGGKDRAAIAAFVRLWVTRWHLQLLV